MAAKKATKKPAAKTSAPAKRLPAIKQKYTKSAILSEISENTDLSKKQVTAVLDELKDLIERHVKKGGAGEFTLPGLLKIKSVKKPARKAQKNAPDRFNPGNFIDIAAKPASKKIKVTPLKALKDFV
ncbi:HU family DNA-binding protein [Pseudomonadales bacterium]|nr:HU family DNA-binding protein [Pseudomonadales bacterium]MDC0892566.1 HU family DNA-binding protein [Pseudomonadales bacterium]